MAAVSRRVFGMPGFRWLLPAVAAVTMVAGVQMLLVRPARAADCPDERADAPAAAATAKACAKPVEVASVRGESARTFANPDGSKTLEMSAVPQRVRRPDGSWVPVDTGLEVVSGGAVVPKATTADVRFSGGGTGALVTFVRDGYEVRLSWPQPLPVPTVSGDTATYAEVLPGVDLRVRAAVDGFTHVLVVKSRDAAADAALRELRYGLGGPDVSVAQTPDGGLSL